ncbi:MAG TPA: GtrA family protein [Burkholderiaceae bacterium]
MPASNSAELQRRLGELLRYAGGSALALALDTGLLMLGLHLNMPLAPAAALGFGAGLALMYAISVRWVFAHRRLGSARQELLLFCAIGVAGLLITEILLALLVPRLSALPAKLLTAGVVFAFNFVSRKALLFTPKKSRSGVQ